MKDILTTVKNERALTVGITQVLIVIGLAFGTEFTAAQLGVISAMLTLVLSIALRQMVSGPVTTAELHGYIDHLLEVIDNMIAEQREEQPPTKRTGT